MKPMTGPWPPAEKKRGDCSPRVQRQPAMHSARTGVLLLARLDEHHQEQGCDRSWPVQYFALTLFGQQISHFHFSTGERSMGAKTFLASKAASGKETDVCSRWMPIFRIWPPEIRESSESRLTGRVNLG